MKFETLEAGTNLFACFSRISMRLNKHSLHCIGDSKTLQPSRVTAYDRLSIHNMGPTFE